MGVFDLLVGLANDHGTVRDHSQDEQALIRIQRDWAEARVKGDSSYTRRLEVDDCTKFVWTDTFVKQGGEWKVVASQVTPVLER
jgi:hypothetical protein